MKRLSAIVTAFFVVITGVTAAAAPSKLFGEINFQSSGVTEGLTTYAFGLDANDKVMPQANGQTTMTTSTTYAKGGANPLELAEAGANNKALRFDLVANQFVMIDLGETVDFTQADKDDFVFEYKLVGAGSTIRMKMDFLDAAETNVAFSMTAGAQSYQVGGDFTDIKAELNKYKTDSVSFQTIKLVFKRSSNTVKVLIDGIEATTLAAWTDVPKGTPAGGFRAEGKNEIRKVKIYKSAAGSNSFYIDDIRAYEQLDTSIPACTVDFEGEFYSNDLDLEDTNVYMFDTSAREHEYGNVAVRLGKGDGTGAMATDGPVIVAQIGGSNCMQLDPAADAIVNFNMAESYSLADTESDNLVFEYDFYNLSPQMRYVTSAMSGTTTVFRATSAATDVNAALSGSSSNFMVNYVYGIGTTPDWHTFRMVVKPRTGTMDYYVDGRIIAIDIPQFDGAVSSAISHFRFQVTKGDSNKPVYIDNVKIYLEKPEEVVEGIRCTQPWVWQDSTYTQISEFKRFRADVYKPMINIKAPQASALSPQDILIVGAHFGQSGTMKGICIKADSITTDAMTKIEGNEYTTTNIQPGDYFRIIVWDKLDRMKPLSTVEYALRTAPPEDSDI